MRISKTMSRLTPLLATVLLPALAPAAAIVTPCSELGAFAAFQKAQVCSIGQFTAKTFTFSGPAGMEGALTPDTVFPIPALADGKVSFGIQGNFQGIVPSGPTVYTLGYTIDPPPEILDGFEASLSFESSFAADMGPGAAIALADPGVMVTFSICAGGLLGSGCPEFYTLTLTNLNPTGLVAFARPTNIVDILQLVKLDPGASFLGTSADVSAVPEPSAAGIFLAGIGTLIGVNWRRGKLRKRVYGGACNWFVDSGIAPGTTTCAQKKASAYNKLLTDVVGRC